MAYKRFPDSGSNNPIRYLTEEQALSVGITPAAYEGKPGKPGKDGKDGITIPSPQIGENGNWYIWNHCLKQWVDTEKPASIMDAYYVAQTKKDLPDVGRTGIIYIIEEDNCILRWDNKAGYFEINTNGRTSDDIISPSTVFTQTAPEKVWNVHHEMNKYPSVIIVDSTGSQVIGDVVYIDQNNLQVHFTSEVSGKVYLN